MHTLLDTLNRPLRDLRISVTDRCNFRCPYCMPKEIFSHAQKFLPRHEILSFEEIVRLSRLFVQNGVEKIRITGGEPLLRRDLTTLIAQLKAIPGLQDLTLTTNGALLDRLASMLKKAGLMRLTVSLDALDPVVFHRMNDVDFPVEKVLASLRVAEAVGFAPIKVNMVVKRGVNDQCILEMAEYFRYSGHILRFIEYMDVGNTNGWRLDDVLSAKEIIAIVHAKWPLVALQANYPGEVANRYRYLDGAGEVGVIASVTQAFCATCVRARISADGQFYTCLFANTGHDFKHLLRGGASDDDISTMIQSVWRMREDRYSEIRSSATLLHRNKVEMSKIGG